jgi:hypothetical protein
MKTLLNKYSRYIAEISDERGNRDGIWVYLKKEYADFGFDPYHPTRQIHEQTQRLLLERFKGVRTITDNDISKFPHLAH